MANEISLSISLAVRKSNLDNSRSLSGSFTLNAASPAKAAGIASIGFAAHEALPMGDVATAGWALFKNLDATNFVNIGIDSGGNFHPTIKLKPGECAACRLASNAPYAKADTAAVKLEYEIWDD